MKRILNLTVLTLTAFILLGTVSVMATERPFALNAEGSRDLYHRCSGQPNSHRRQQFRYGDPPWFGDHRRDDQFQPRPC